MHVSNRRRRVIPNCIKLGFWTRDSHLGQTLRHMFSIQSTGLYWSTLGLLLGSNGLISRQSTVAFTNSTDCVGINAISPNCSSNETPYYRDFFYIGGHYEDSALGNLTCDQIYVEKLTPTGGIVQPKPIIFFHGGGMCPFRSSVVAC